MDKDERLKWLKQIEKDIYVCSLDSTFADDAKSCAIHSVIEELENQKTGHWIKDGDSYSDLYDYKIRCHCSICGNEKFFIDRKTTSGTPCIKNCDNVDKYCSNCGAKMKGENNE